MAFLPPSRVLIRGGGEMGSGVAWRLFRAGYEVVITEIEHPMAIRRWVCFSEAIYDGRKEVEGVIARRSSDIPDANRALGDGHIPIVICPDAAGLPVYRADVIVDATMTKRGQTTPRGLAASVVGLGPGFVAGGDVDCVIETNRGPNLGRCIWSGSAEANTGVPGLLGGETNRRVLRAPADGAVEPLKEIGVFVRAGDIVARVNGVDVIAETDGVLRGMMRPSIPVSLGAKIGDVDPRANREICRRISDKALAIAGGVLEALLSDPVSPRL